MSTLVTPRVTGFQLVSPQKKDSSAMFMQMINVVLYKLNIRVKWPKELIILRETENFRVIRFAYCVKVEMLVKFRSNLLKRS